MARTVNYKCLMDPGLKKRVDALVDARRTKLTPATESLWRWLLEQDTLLQSMLLGGVDPADFPEVARLVLDRLAKPRRREPKDGAVRTSAGGLGLPGAGGSSDVDR